MDIGALQFNSAFQKEVVGKLEEQKTKDFDNIFQKALEDNDKKQLKKACVELESYMLSQLFKNMKKSMVSEESLIPKGDYEKMFEDYKINNQCEELTKAGGIGLADMLYRQMTLAYGNQAADKTSDLSQMSEEA